MTDQNVVAVVGPTASGKSDLAVDIARFIISNKKRFSVDGAEIISADSRQIYKGLDLSSGKITQKEMRGIKHHLLDIASPRRSFTVAQFQKKAGAVLRDCKKRNIVPIVCGGTGFWADTLLKGYRLPNVAPNKQLRAGMQKMSVAELFKQLQTKDPARSKTIDPHNKVRLIRALEIVDAKGHITPLRASSPYRVLWLGIKRPRTELTKRIHIRLLQRLRAGMIAEIKHTHECGVSYRRLESLGLEFKWIARFLQKKISRDEMINGLEKEIIQYAKRQMTWFKKNKNIVWIEKARLPGRVVAQFLMN